MRHLRVLATSLFFVTTLLPRPSAQISASSERLRELSLDQRWDAFDRSAPTAAQELGRLLSPFGKPSRDMSPVPTLRIYKDVTYLMPAQAAKDVLAIPDRLPTKTRVVGQGLPKDSLFTYSFSGGFDIQFNQLKLVVDKADQVVSVQLINTNPSNDRSFSVSNAEARVWSYYDYLTPRRKSGLNIRIGHRLDYLNAEGTWKFHSLWDSKTPEVTAPEVVRIQTTLWDPKARFPAVSGDAKVLEHSRWFLPQPLIGIILETVSKSTHGLPPPQAALGR